MRRDIAGVRPAGSLHLRRGSPLALAAALMVLAAPVLGAAPASRRAPDVFSLAGTWGFRLDPGKVGVERRWFAAPLPERVRLPGSTDENRKGTPNTRKPDLNTLSRLYEYAGPAWYQREVVIPAAWRGRRVTLSLERCHWETRVWVDGTPFGLRDSLCVPHVYDLTAALTPGRHRLTIRVDNTLRYNLGTHAHSVSEQTQTNWNGVIGRLELRATSPVWVEDLQVYPDVDRKAASVRIALGNATGKPVSGTLALRVGPAGGGPLLRTLRRPFRAETGSSELRVDLPMGPGVRLWDEFNPALYELTASLHRGGSRTPLNERRTTFGMRHLAATGKRLVLNGRPIFLRGTLECCIFPLTGYPPTDVASWLRIFRIARSYGLNHLRFHSWCPPEAAFAAADRSGFLLHVEAPQWVADVGKDPARDRFIEEEMARILRVYGSHPSFGFFCLGNELGGDASFLQRLVEKGKREDPRHLYTASTAWSFTPSDDYNVAVIRGLHGPSTDRDFREADARLRTPVVSHEIGQWTIYPNLAEIRKYTGVLRARNFDLVRQDLAARGMLDQAPAFTRASGQLMVRLYKEEIEVLLRTPGHAGFQLLDLHDFPGQGTALVGALDPFWDSKGLISPRDFRRFCGPTVPLVRLPQRVFTADETLTARAEVAHFGPATLRNAAPYWTLTDERGRRVAGGDLPPATLETGCLSPLGEIRTSLAAARAPARLTLTLGLRGTEAANSWDLWVYPARVDTSAPADVVVARAWNEETASALAAGRKVLLLASSGILAKSIPGSFTPVFWSPIWFRGGAGTMGILCNPRHPSLAGFPTAEHTDWQWYDLLQRSRSVVLDDLPRSYRPIVQIIDNFSRNHRLGSLFEARVGGGRLLVCSLNLWSDLDQRPAARQMLHSLLAYVGSDRFQPAQSLDPRTLGRLFRDSEPLQPVEMTQSLRDAAVLHVKAARRVPAKNTPEAWQPEADEVVVRQPGFNYSVRGGTWRDDAGAAWHDGEDLRVRVTCPRGFRGTLYAHLHDWNNLGRVADLLFEGKAVGTLEAYQQGVWLAFPVTAEDTADGVLELSARPTQANAMITEVLLTRP